MRRPTGATTTIFASAVFRGIGDDFLPRRDSVRGGPGAGNTLREFARRQRVRRELRRDACINHAGSNNAGA